MPHIVKNQQNNTRMVVFDTRYFEVKGKQYEILGTAFVDGETFHYIKNIATGEKKDISMSQLLKWFER